MKRSSSTLAPKATASRVEEARLRILLKRRDEQLRSAQAEIDNFAYSVSHDLRAPLIHIGGFVDLLLQHAEATLDQQSRHYLQRIAESTYRMGRMVDDVLALSRLSRAEMHLIRLELNDLIKEVMNDVREQASRRPIDWHIGNLPTVEADPTLLRAAVVNLVANALKFTSKVEKPRIEIGATRGNAETILYVKDNGAGFDMKHQERLFGVFQRLHSAAEYEGSGVGLAQVRRILQRHGGRTWAEGTPGQGATFFVSLPDEGTEAP